MKDDSKDHAFAEAIESHAKLPQLFAKVKAYGVLDIYIHTYTNQMQQLCILPRKVAREALFRIYGNLQ